MYPQNITLIYLIKNDGKSSFWDSHSDGINQYQCNVNGRLAVPKGTLAKMITFGDENCNVAVKFKNMRLLGTVLSWRMEIEAHNIKLKLLSEKYNFAVIVFYITAIE